MRTPIIAAALIGLAASTAGGELILLKSAQNNWAVFDTPNFTTATASANPHQILSNCGFQFISLGVPAYRPTDGYLYGYGSFNTAASTTLYRVNAINGLMQVIAPVGSAWANTVVPVFNPDSSELRVIRYNAANTVAENLRVDPATGAIIATETNLFYTNASGIPLLNSLALTPDSPPRLLGLDFVKRAVVEIGSAAGGEASWNTGAVTKLVDITFPDNQWIGGLGISKETGVAYVQYSQNNVGSIHVRNLATVNMSTGQLTVVAQPGSPGPHVSSTIFLDDNVAPPPICPGDANADLNVNACDLSIVLSLFGDTVPPPDDGANFGDYNADGIVNAADLSVLLANFGGSC